MKKQSLIGRALVLMSLPLATALSPPAPAQEQAYDSASVAKGQRLFAINCTACHGNDGKATVNMVADATDLTDPKLWRNGTSRQDIFTSINKGRAVDMPAFEWILDGEEEVWHLTNFVLSLWPEAARQKALQDAKQ